MSDRLHKFLFEGLPVRGMLVQLHETWRELLSRRAARSDGGHAFAPEVRQLLGEMSAAVCLMHANIKFDGALILQVFGDGPVKLAVAEARSDLGFRATAKVVGEVASGAQLPTMLNLHGQGRCAITLDPSERSAGRQPYQGVVPLHGDRREPLQRLAQVLEHYMLQSEQLDTRLVLAADDRCAAGLLIQRLPAQGDSNLSGSGWKEGDEDGIGRSEDFNRIAHLTATLTAEELLNLQPEQILRRLFWEETVRLFDPLQPRFACTCSRQRVAGMLRGLGRDEVDSLLAEQGEAEVACDFCGAVYRFDAVDVGEVFVAAHKQTPGSQAIN
ncbi:MAG TPA: Hsp33 family molecular chaperone HslO [Burkholderiaceae bacterium]|nr:Hsp33 family molecular chaperone HslO [Burkholderiaceae bacterium]